MTTKATDPAFSKEADTLSGTYIDVNGVGRDITITLQYPENLDSSIKEPLNKREYMATEIIKSIMTDSRFVSMNQDQMAELAVKHADALITQLNNIPIP